MQRDQRAVRLVDKHLPAGVDSPELCQELVRQLSQRRNVGLFSRIFRLVIRLILIYAFCSVSLHALENTFPNLSKTVRTGRTLSYLNLIYLKSYRWLSVKIGLYRSEFLHSRDREACLVPNPFYKPPEMCCDCPEPIRIRQVSLNSKAGRLAYRRAVDRHVAPLHVVDSGHKPVSFAQLRTTVLNAWSEVSAGSNRVASVPSKGGPSTLAELVEQEQLSAATRLTSWIFGHMSAIRAMRRLVPRPPFIQPDVETSMARAFYLLTGQLEHIWSVGDLSQFQGQAVLMALHGHLRVTLAHKPACCPGSHGNASAVLSPGQALVVPTSCFQAYFSRHDNTETYTLAYLFSVFSSTGINQAAPITGRVPEDDGIDD